ncbi:MAG: DUF1971 domain-containing protein [Pseudomonadota bacterium]|jgi:tellurite resistance-related uncharacterized protein
MKTLPDEVRPYQRTPVFTETTVPAGLLRAHTTKAGTWGRILVLEGRLRYRILSPAVEEVLLTPERFGVVEPQVPHEVAPDGPVKFLVEFLRVPEPKAQGQARAG